MRRPEVGSTRLLAWLAVASLLNGLPSCGGTPPGPNELPDSPKNQYWDVVIAGTVVMADPPLAALPGVMASWYTCSLSGHNCTASVVTDSLGHYSISHTFIVPVCVPGKRQSFSQLGVVVSLPGYQSAGGESIHLTTDFCSDVHLAEDFALHRLP